MLVVKTFVLELPVMLLPVSELMSSKHSKADILIYVDLVVGLHINCRHLWELQSYWVCLELWSFTAASKIKARCTHIPIPLFLLIIVTLYVVL